MDVREISREAEAAKALLANLRDVIGDDEQAAEDFLEGETGFKEAISAAVEMIGEWEAFAEALSSRIGEMKARKDRLENRVEMTRAAIASAMGAVNMRKITLPVATLTLKATPPKVIVTEESDIPSNFWKPQPPKLDKQALGDALKDGRTIAGATLSNGGSTIQVKRV